jgi:hypothetical protein
MTLTISTFKHLFKYPNKSYENYQSFGHWNYQAKHYRQKYLSKIIFEMEITTKKLKTILHTKAYLPWEIPQRRNYIGEAQRRR